MRPLASAAPWRRTGSVRGTTSRSAGTPCRSETGQTPAQSQDGSGSTRPTTQRVSCRSSSRRRRRPHGEASPCSPWCRPQWAPAGGASPSRRQRKHRGSSKADSPTQGLTRWAILHRGPLRWLSTRHGEPSVLREKWSRNSATVGGCAEWALAQQNRQMCHSVSAAQDRLILRALTQAAGHWRAHAPDTHPVASHRGPSELIHAGLADECGLVASNVGTPGPWLSTEGQVEGGGHAQHGADTERCG